jgi:hypothetical protein
MMSIEKPLPDERYRAPASDPLTRFFGGSPLAVIFRLALLSILVGVILATLGLDPLDILNSLRRLFASIWDMGFEAVRRLARYFLLGAAIVVPIWLVIRLIRAPGRR